MTQANQHPLLAEYDARVASGALRADTGQRMAMQGLGLLAAHLLYGTKTAPSLAFWRKSEKTVTGGLYLWGEVGRGKSMLMDLFVDFMKQHNIPTRRVHFHALMLEVHKRLHQLRQAGHTDDVMLRVVAEIAEETKLLCLDEFQVTDVTDAMILSRLFGGLITAGVTLVFTSNRYPRDLYQGGLQRDQFLKFVDELEQHVRIVKIDSPLDYRLQQMKALQQTYQFPLGEKADDFLCESWKALVGAAPNEPLKLEVQGRTLHLEKHAHGIAWLTFQELCERPLGANDYLTLAKVCHTILLQGIPKMSPELRNEAKRFVTLIDALYDCRVKLVATAEAAPDDLYPAGDGSFEFHRTASRLHEMQSETYLALPHLHS